MREADDGSRGSGIREGELARATDVVEEGNLAGASGVGGDGAVMVGVAKAAKC